MIVNRVPDLVAEKFGGKDKVNMSQVQRETGLEYQTVLRWMKSRVDRADFPVLDVWCAYLKVGVGDLLQHVAE